MNIRPFARGLALVTLLAAAPGASVAQNDPAAADAERVAPSWVTDHALFSMQQRIDFGRNWTISAAFIDENGTTFHAVGPLDVQGLDENTVYEIGSITKTFTGVLLADMVKKGELSLDDPIDAHLPESVKAPGGGRLTLAHLANHTSGLPRMPANFDSADPLDPYADYSRDALFAALDGYELEFEPGERMVYSNFGMGLLGRILADKAGMTYEELVRERILDPLEMTMSAIDLSDAQKRRLIPGFRDATPTPNWTFGELEGAGAIRSTAADMAKYVAANMGLVDSPLAAAFELSHADGPAPGETGLGWHRAGENGHIVWHNGATGGYASFVGFLPEEKRGVVLLSNTSASVDDLGLHILDDTYPLTRIYRSVARRVGAMIRKRNVKVAIAAYANIKADPETEFEFHEGALNSLGYDLMREGRLADAIEIFKLNAAEYPESGNVYDSLAEAYEANGDRENAIVNYKLSIDKNRGNVNALAKLKEFGVEYEAATVEVPEELLAEYVGTYELAPNFFVEITAHGETLRAQATSQMPFDLIPVSETTFALAGINASIEFMRNEEGAVHALTLHQQGQQIAHRVEG